MPTHVLGWLQEKVLAALLRLGSVRREIFVAVAFLILLFFVGTLGCMLIED